MGTTALVLLAAAWCWDGAEAWGFSLRRGLQANTSSSNEVVQSSFPPSLPSLASLPHSLSLSLAVVGVVALAAALC